MTQNNVSLRACVSRRSNPLRITVVAGDCFVASLLAVTRESAEITNTPSALENRSLGFPSSARGQQRGNGLVQEQKAIAPVPM